MLTNDLESIRTLHNMSQSELASKVGVTRQTINGIEKGRYNPSLIIALKIAQIFTTTVENIFHLSDES